MKLALLVLSTLPLCNLIAQTQQTLIQRRPFIRAAGEATVSIKPDQAKIDLGVVTQAATAQEASAQNATQVNAVLAQLQTLLGAGADIKTISYSLTPNYNSPRDGSPPMLIGYTATNIVEVTTGDLSAVGKIIDTAIQAGANRVQGLQFGLKDDQPVRGQALRLATIQAKAHADAMASGLGVRTGAVLSVEEGIPFRVQPVDIRTAAVVSASTPVEAGLLDIRATVTLEVEIAP